MLRTALPVLGPLAQSVMLTVIAAVGCLIAFGVGIWLLVRRR